MMRPDLFQRPSKVLAAACLLALSGCASEALNNQLANSREAIDQARIAGASQIAPADFDAAVDKLNRANAAAEKRWGGKDEAMTLAQQAQVDANLARAKTDAERAKIAAAQITKSNELLRELNRANPKNPRGE